jgi:ferredoxin-NADP reductase
VILNMRFEATVKNIIARTSDVKSFRFSRPVDFTYKAGQFIVVTITKGEIKLKKPFSISSSPTEQDFIEFTKKLTGHEYSNALNMLTIGDLVEIDGPHGNFTFEGEYKKLCLLSGGVGITPLRSICKYSTDLKLDVNIILLYGNRTEQNIIFRDDFELMQRQNQRLKVVLTLDEPGARWTGESGIITAEMIKRNVSDYMTRVFYICGPPGMLQSITQLLESLSVAETCIKTEKFIGY